MTSKRGNCRSVHARRSSSVWLISPVCQPQRTLLSHSSLEPMGLQQGRVHRLNTPGAWELALIRGYVVVGQLIQIRSGPSRWKCGLPNRANAHLIVLIKASAIDTPSQPGARLGLRVNAASESIPTTALPPAPSPGPAQQGSEAALGSLVHPLGTKSPDPL